MGKRFKIIIILLFVLVIMMTFLIMNEPLIQLKGQKEINLNLNDDYIELGYKGKTRLEEMTDNVIVTSDIDNKKIGKYQVKYKLKYLFNTKTVIRSVNVIDNIKPKIKLKGKTEIIMYPDDNYKEEGYEVTDNYDKDLKKKVKIEKTDKEIIYRVKDSSGNEDVKIRKITSPDKESPNLILKGNDVIVLKIGEKYKEEGYTAIDNHEGDITNKVITLGYVDNKHVGNYKLTYIVKDKSGNETRRYRTIFITKKNNYNGGIIYLTFDDGPSSDITPTILDILKEEKVNATFFVTNKSDELNYLIERENKEGHSVGLHTATHNYSYVYSSSEAYFEDLKVISDKVKRITKKDTKIIRFPGGSSNTVSIKYSPGIMSYLVDEVENRGYYYYDWNVDSGDATRKFDADGIYNNVISSLKPNRENTVLMHDFALNNPTKEALRRIIKYGKEKGYIFATITETTRGYHHRVNN